MLSLESAGYVCFKEETVITTGGVNNEIHFNFCLARQWAIGNGYCVTSCHNATTTLRTTTSIHPYIRIMHYQASLVLYCCMLFCEGTAFHVQPSLSVRRSTNAPANHGSTASSSNTSAATSTAGSQDVLYSSSKPVKRDTAALARRDVFAISSKAIALPLALLTQNPASSSALESRNEGLCGTGLFEHFQEWRCTTIGNILDEGVSKDLKEGDTVSIDSLMGKLGVSMDDLNSMDADSSEKDAKKVKGSKGRIKDASK